MSEIDFFHPASTLHVFQASSSMIFIQQKFKMGGVYEAKKLSRYCHLAAFLSKVYDFLPLLLCTGG